MAPAPQLQQLLSKLRAPIFNTLPVLSNVRTGNKYLRRRLKGPAILNYHPQFTFPNVKLATSNSPHNKYVIEEGSLVGEFKRRPRPGPAGMGPDAKPSRWLEVSTEHQRFEDVARKRKLGKNPPKKGEGKRSALGKGNKK